MALRPYRTSFRPALHSATSRIFSPATIRAAVWARIACPYGTSTYKHGMTADANLISMPLAMASGTASGIIFGSRSRRATRLFYIARGACDDFFRAMDSMFFFSVEEREVVASAAARKYAFNGATNAFYICHRIDFRVGSGAMKELRASKSKKIFEKNQELYLK
jgi:hypothetical protein